MIAHAWKMHSVGSVKSFASRRSRAALAALVLGSGCGGSTHESAARDPRGAEPLHSRSTAEEEEPVAGPRTPHLPSCEDGTCFACGETICMAGFYCDERAPGGAVCSWLPECTGKSACSCLEKQLGQGCACQEQSGGPHVTCK
jgi:hypothetical protein